MLEGATVTHRVPADLVAEVPSGRGYRVRSAKPGLWVLLAAFLGLNLLDGLTTRSVLARGGMEGNPVLLWLMVNSSFANMLFFKVAASVLLVGLLARFYWHTYAARITWALVLGLLVVVIHNLFALAVSSAL